MRVRSAGLLAVALLAVAACGSTKKSSSSTPGAATQARTTPPATSETGCRSQLTVGDRLTLRVQVTAPQPAKYTVVRFDGANDLTVDAITDGTGARGRLNRITGDYVLPGPRSITTRSWSRSPDMPSSVCRASD